MSVHLEIHCCKFYNQDIQVQHTYFLVIPRDDTISIEVQLDQSAEINEEKINALEMELWNKQYHITSILGYLASISYNPWDRDVYRGFAKMCDGELKKLVSFHLCLHWVETSLESFLFAWTASWGHSIMTSKCSSCIADGGTFMDNGMTMFGRYHHELVVAQDYFE